MTNSTRLVGVFLMPFLVLIPLGMIHVAARRRTPLTIVVLVGFVFAPIAAVAVVPEEPYASDRELAVLVFGVLLASYGLERLFSSGSRGARAAALALVSLVPAHFAFFLFDYFGDYHRRAGFWFEWNHLGALDEIIAHDADGARPVFLSNGDDAMMDTYWRLALRKHHRDSLIDKTVYFDARRLDPSKLPPHALVLITRNDTGWTSLAASGRLRQLAAIPEPGDVPYFIVVEN
jgi:hypothetical protein